MNWRKDTMNPGIRIAVLVLAIGCALFAQDNRPAAVPHGPEHSTDAYKVDYVFSEMQDGKRVNARSYTVLIRAGDKANIRLGSRVPFMTGSPKEGVPPQYQYLDIGMDVDASIERAADSGVAPDSGVALITVLDVSRVAAEKPEQGRSFLPPVIRSTKLQIRTIVPLGKPTLLTSADE